MFAFAIKEQCERDGFDSPLEVVFLVWWKTFETIELISGVDLRPQVEVEAGGKTYRVDFLLEPSQSVKTRSYPRIAVELDGHAFHERTKEQVAYRNQRDRDLQSSGWLVLHYSGSELVRDPQACVFGCWKTAHNAFRAEQVTG